MRNRLPDGDDEGWRVAALRRGEQTRLGGMSAQHQSKKAAAKAIPTGDVASAQAPADVDECMSDWQVVLAHEDESVATEAEWGTHPVSAGAAEGHIEQPEAASARPAGAARAPKPDEGE